MKITTNYSDTQMQRGVRLLAPLLMLTSLCLLATLSWLVVKTVTLRQTLPELQQRLARVEGYDSVPSSLSVSLPPAQELAAIRDRVRRVNAVSQTRGLSTAALLSTLEKHLPSQAWLVSLHHRATAGEVTLLAAAERADTLSNFLLKLESDPMFEQALLARELPSSTASTRAVQYEIHLKVRP